jgi:hypothetical protein
MLLVTVYFQMQAVKKETSGRFENALLAVVQSVCYPARYFAQVHTLDKVSLHEDCSTLSTVGYELFWWLIFCRNWLTR